MSIYWVNPAIGSDGNDGSANDAAHAWATIQKAIDTITAAEHTIYLVSAGTGNDEQPSVEIDFDGASGAKGAIISFIGVNPSGVDDGTRYVIDGNSLGAGLSLWKFYTSGSYYYFKNIELNNAKDNACELAGASSYPLFFNNVVLHGSTNSAIDTYGKNIAFYRCRFSSNGGNGIYRPWNAQFIFCIFKDNTGEGCKFYHMNNAFLFCIFHNNGGNAGLYLEDALPDGGIFGNVFDGNTGDGLGSAVTDGNYASYLFPAILGNRFTNNGGSGIDFNFNTNGQAFEDFNFYLNNAVNAKEGDIIEGGNSLTTGIEGYTDKANDDFTLTSSATLRRSAVVLP